MGEAKRRAEAAEEHPAPPTPTLGTIKDLSRYDYNFRWIASYPKSGNTWVRLFIHAYRSGTVDINGLGNQSDSSRVAWQSATAMPLPRLTQMASCLVRPSAMYNLQQLFATFAVERPIVKTHSCNMNVHYIPMIPLDITSTAVLVLRDPRDVVCSWTRHFECTHDHAIDRISDKACSLDNNGILHVLSDWSTHTTSWAKDWVFKVRYEDLLTHPEEMFAKVIEHIGDPWDEKRFKKALELTRIDNLRRQEEEHGFVEHRGNDRFFRKGEARQWEKELTRKQVRKIEEAHGEVMGKVGYL